MPCPNEPDRASLQVNENTSLQSGVQRREVWSWAMYDFANSGYTTVVITAVFNAYFVSAVAGGAPWATLAWTAALAVSYLIIMVTGPVIGAYADAHAAKKKLLAITTVGCVVCTAALALVEPGDLWLAVVFIVLSNAFFGAGENLIAAFLPEIAQGEAMGRVSGWGWSLGYVGGLVSLGCSLAYVSWAQSAGLPASDFVPVTMFITAALFALASLPAFVFLRERAQNATATYAGARHVFGTLCRTLRDASSRTDLRRFLLCLVFYQAGIQAVVALAAIYAQQAMGFTTQDTIALILVVNVTAAIGALLFGQVQDRLGHVRTLVLTLLGWLTAIALAWAAQSTVTFWLAANVVGLSLGASQSAGRALVGYLSPPARSAEFFGLWGFAVKLSAVLGPLTYGVVTWISAGDHRLALLITGAYFVAGIAIALRIDARRGRLAALA
ncbi:MAG: MFS transporter [Pseudomonadota bacterium]